LAERIRPLRDDLSGFEDQEIGRFAVGVQRGVIGAMAAATSWGNHHQPGSAGLLAEGGRRGAPAAEQVTDRFHLIQNLKQAVQEELASRHCQLLMAAAEFSRQNEPEKAAMVVVSKPRQARSNFSQKQVRQQMRQQKMELFQMVKSLRAQGLKVRDIMRQPGICRALVNKWLRLEE
jgi:hypothetical protein